MNAQSIKDTTNEIEKKHLIMTEYSATFFLDIVRHAFSYLQGLFV